MKLKVLVLAEHFIPAVKGGGPIRSIKNLVDNLYDKIDFYIITSDRDLGDDKPFDNIELDKWVQVGKAKVLYTDFSKLSFRKIVRLINSVKYDVLYLNSFFSFKITTIPLFLRRLKLIPRKRVVLAPRGQFSLGALSLKSRKKKLFILLTRLLGLYKGIIWQATTEFEKDDIKNIFGKEADIKIANNLTNNYKEYKYNKEITKEKGELRVVFLSRIHPKKNLKMAIQLLKNIKGKVKFEIYGPIEDKDYWNECKELVSTLPTNIEVCYQGVASHNNVINIFKKNHIFLFPTLGENFGHVIAEALSGGCPVIISDQTPWRELEEKGVGWDISLNDKDKFVRTIQLCVDLEQDEYNKLSENAFSYIKKNINLKEEVENSFNLFK